MLRRLLVRVCKADQGRLIPRPCQELQAKRQSCHMHEPAEVKRSCQMEGACKGSAACRPVLCPTACHRRYGFVSNQRDFYQGFLPGLSARRPMRLSITCAGERHWHGDRGRSRMRRDVRAVVADLCTRSAGALGNPENELDALVSQDLPARETAVEAAVCDGRSHRRRWHRLLASALGSTKSDRRGHPRLERPWRRSGWHETRLGTRPASTACSRTAALVRTSLASDTQHCSTAQACQSRSEVFTRPGNTIFLKAPMSPTQGVTGCPVQL